MDTYSFLRELADSWVLIALFVFFVGSVIWAYRPGSGELHGQAREIPFRHDEAPRGEEETGR